MREQNMSDGRSVVEPQQSQNKLNRAESKHNYQELSQHCKPSIFQFKKKNKENNGNKFKSYWKQGSRDMNGEG